MTDRELLERAARAADVFVVGGVPVEPCNQMPSGWKAWRPLQCDGDAFRLMVDLNMSVNVHLQDVEADGNAESFGDDPRAATRRAIVRAAAEMIHDQGCT